jgi:hypothetical protein
MFHAGTLEPMTPPERDALMKALPKGRLIEPAEIASLTVFLAVSHSTPQHTTVIDASMGQGLRPGLMTDIRAETRLDSQILITRSDYSGRP